MDYVVPANCVVLFDIVYAVSKYFSLSIYHMQKTCEGIYFGLTKVRYICLVQIVKQKKKLKLSPMYVAKTINHDGAVAFSWYSTGPNFLIKATLT